MRQILGAFVVTRVALVVVIIAALSSSHPSACDWCVDASANPLLAGLARWDGAAYLDIAQHGYDTPGGASNEAYSPLYPLLMHLGGTALGGSTDAYLVAGILISNVALLLALRLLILLATHRIGGDGARRAGLYVLVFPTTVFLSAVYAEGLFLALGIGSAREAERANWWRAGLFAALASLARPFGVLAVLPLAFALIRACRRVSPITLVSAALAPLALLSWAGYLYRLSGDPLRVMNVYSSWGSEPRSPFHAFTDLLDPTIYGFPWFVLGLIVLFTGLVAASWRIAGAGQAVFATASLVVFASSGSLTSSMRYELALYPAFIVLGALTKRRRGFVLWTTASAGVALVFTALFSLWLWVG